MVLVSIYGNSDLFLFFSIIWLVIVWIKKNKSVNVLLTPAQAELNFPLLPFGWMARNLSMLLVFSQSQGRVYVPCVWQHASLGTATLWSVGQHCQEQLLASHLQSYSGAGNSDQSFLLCCRYILKTTTFPLGTTEWWWGWGTPNTKLWLRKIFIVNPLRSFIEKLLRYQEPYCKDIKVSFTILNL